ncbi:MAG TPA: alpha/beta hydrolase, partial [Polyangiaceae bacterium]
ELEALLAKFRIHTNEDALRFVETILHAKPTGLLRHLIARDLVRRHKTPSLRALIKDVPNAKPFEPGELAHLAPIPTYFMWGKSERLLPPSHLEFWKKHLRNATIDEPYGFGHSPQLDSPRDLARRVIAFARDH